MTGCFRWIWGGTLLLASLIAFAGFATAASAHAELERAVPAGGGAVATVPKAIELRFTETVDPSLTSISLVASDGTPVRLQSLTIDPADPHVVRATLSDPASLAPGVYTVIWGAYSSEDGHASNGSFTFSIGTGEAPVQELGVASGVSSPSIVAKWFELIGFVLLTGLAFFSSTSTVASGQIQARFRAVVLALSAIAFAGAGLSLRAREAAVSGSSLFGGIHTEILAELLESTYGHAWPLRVGALAVAVGVAWLFPSAWAARRDSVLLICGMIGLASIAVSGHTRAVESAWLATMVDFVHMLAAGVWLGGLLGVLLMLSPGSDTEADQKLLGEQGRRFEVAVVIIVLAGIAAAYWHVGGRRSLLDSDYGRTLLIKIAIVVAMLGFAWYNRRVLQAGPSRRRWIPLVVGAELGLGLLVLLFSADLSQTPPAKQPLSVRVAARALEVSKRATVGDTTVSMSGILTGDPTDVLTLVVLPDTELQRVIVRASLDTDSGMTVGDRFDAVAVDGRPGTFVFPSGRLGIAGRWDLEITIRRAGVQDEVVSFPLDTSQLSTSATRSAADQWGGFRMTTHTVLALALAVAMLIIGLGGLRRITGLEPLASAFLLAASLVIAGGFVVSAARSVIPTTPGHALSAPIDTFPGSLTYAGDLYRANCAVCHGADGRGVGNANPAHLHGNDADLTGNRTNAQSDGDLFEWISNGVPGTRMPAFDQALSAEERWRLVEYLRHLQAEARKAETGE